MFEKNMRLAYLIDFYIDLLDSHSAGILKAYYDDDLSLAEIASGENISRQGIRHIIKRCEEQILFLEDRLGLAKRYSELESAKDKLEEIKAQLEKDGEVKLASEIDEVIGIILNKGV